MASTSENIPKDSTESEDDETSIYLDNVTKTFANGSIVAVKDVDLEISSDEFVVFLGPSGCGKTTTLRCIAGLETPDQGRILIGDKDVTKEKPKNRDLAFVFQQVTLFPHMDVRANMRFGLDMNTDLSDDEKNSRVEEAASMLGISELLDRKPSDLSGGQQQRVSLGRAMVMEPVAFLLDEPFSALDANLRDQMQTEVKRLHNNLERAMIFVTHDQEEAMTVADKIVVMDDARIQQIGTPHKVYNDPSNQFVAQFIGSPAPNFFESKIERKEGEIYITTDLFSIKASDEQAEQITSYTGQTVEIGIRPEYMNLDVSEPIFQADVEFVEPQGPNDSVYLSVDGKEIRSTTAQGIVDDGQSNVNVNFEKENIWIFDQSGERLV